MSRSEPSQVAAAADLSLHGARGATREPPFARYHRGDRNFFLIYVALIWLAILSGFGPQIVKHLQTQAPAYPLIVHFHAVAFVGWLVLLTAQVLLIRFARPDIHRSLGLLGAGLAVAMIVLGPATAIVTDRLRLALPNPDPAFLIVQMTDIVAFAGLAGAAFAWRKDPAAHKRLIVLATAYIADAGFDRWWGGPMEALFGDGLGGYAAQLYTGTDLLVLGVGLYDWITRRRLHPAYIAGIAWIAALQLIALFCYTNPQWGPVARSLLSGL